MLLPTTVYAQTTKTQSNTATNGQALEIAPPVIYLNADPGQTVKANIYIRDISSGNLNVTGQVNSFTASGEDGTPKIQLEDTGTDVANSIVGWVETLPKLQLIPREIKTMVATINVPKDATPGGHYGVVRFTATPPSVEGGSGVSLSAGIGVLILLTVSGQVNEGLSVEELSVAKPVKDGETSKAASFFESSPLLFTVRLKNTGNVHVRPTGQVVITNMFGRKFAAVNINVPPANVLPSSIRKFSEELNKEVIGNKRMFGKYTAELKLTYGSNKTITKTVSFWVIPYKQIAAAIIIIIGLFFLARYLLKLYTRRVIAGSSKRRR